MLHAARCTIAAGTSKNRIATPQWLTFWWHVSYYAWVWHRVSPAHFPGSLNPTNGWPFECRQNWSHRMGWSTAIDGHRQMALINVFWLWGAHIVTLYNSILTQKSTYLNKCKIIAILKQLIRWQIHIVTKGTCVDMYVSIRCCTM